MRYPVGPSRGNFVSPADRRLVDCIRAWHLAEHGHAVSGAISDAVERLVRAQGTASDAADDVASAAADFGADSPEVEQAIGTWLSSLATLVQNYQTLLQQPVPGEPSRPALPAVARPSISATGGMPPGALVLARRAPASSAGPPPLAYYDSQEDAPRRSPTPSFVPPWPAGSSHAPTSTARRVPRPIPIASFRGLGRSPLLSRY